MLLNIELYQNIQNIYEVDRAAPAGAAVAAGAGAGAGGHDPSRRRPESLYMGQELVDMMALAGGSLSLST